MLTDSSLTPAQLRKRATFRKWRENRSPEQIERDRDSSRRYRAKCKTVRTPEQKERRRELKRIAQLTPEQIEQKRKWARNHHRKIAYNLTPEEWDVMFEEQGRRCAICKTKDAGRRHWATDHCHRGTGVRGILCHGCNIGLGGFRDNVEFIISAAYYLLKHALNVARRLSC